mmetsp:Transcript_11823/g.18317  ORF Transcript_11823/g.18317 Transcript_11823/m.18317 type:complete len:318 (-) Transcript_11823:162-1115(-)
MMKVFLWISTVSQLLLIWVKYADAFTFHQPGYSPKRTFALASSRKVIDWYVQQPLESLVPKEEALAILSELINSDAMIDDTEALVSRNWDSLDRRLREESRSTAQILGQETTDRVLRSVSNLNEYDSGAVRAFLESDAINNLFAKVLYDGIFEFTQKIDIFGNILSRLPIIGPIRKQIVSETKKNLDKTLGPLVQQFLGTYTKVAVGEATDFVLSASNRESFGAANVRLVSSLMERPVNSLLPDKSVTDKLKDDAFSYIRNVEIEDLRSYLDFAYDFIGDKSVENVVPVDKFLDASPTLQRTVDNLWEKALIASREE